MTVIDDYIAQLREYSRNLAEMCGVYPGDPDNELQTEAYLLNKAADWLCRINWETERLLYLETIPEVTITYANDG